MQTGVAPGTIGTTTVVVVRGRVVGTNGAALAGVRVSVQGRAEYGQTLTRTNGEFDLVVNGGCSLPFNFNKLDYLPVQRTVNLPWASTSRSVL